MKRQNSLTTLLIVVITGSFLIEKFLYPDLFGKFALAGSSYTTEHSQYYRFLTVALLHAGWMHLLFNMLALLQLGTIVENFLGELRYIIVLLASLLAGSFMSWHFMSPQGSSVGASGMIFGLFGSLLVLGKRAGADPKQVLSLVIVNLLFTFFPGSNIDWHAHVGGLLGGVLATLVVRGFNSSQKRLRNI